MQTSHQNSKNGTKKFLKTSTFQTKYCILICYHPSVSDLDVPYIIAKIPINKYQHRYKFIETSKNLIFKNQKYIDDFKHLTILNSVKVR